MGIVGADTQRPLSLDHFRLPSPPAVAIRILEAVRNPDTTVQELSNILSSDPALTVRILNMANSAMYSHVPKVDSVKRAITLMGINALKNIALSFIIVEGMNRELRGRIDLSCMWKKSIVAAVAAEMLCKQFRIGAEEVFAGTLLQDIGCFLMAASYPTLYRQILEAVKDPGVAINKLEMEHLGCDHQELGHEILSKWGLPEGICNLVRFHHRDPAPSLKLSSQIAVVSLANKIASTLCGMADHQKVSSLLTLLSDRHRIPAHEAEELMGDIQAKALEILSFFEIDAGSMKSISQILQEANEELGKLNLSYQQLVLELEQAKEKAEILARQLAQANSHLRELAYKDSLTGLYNHGYFQELLEKELSRAIRYRKPLSLILFDLDHFKRVNDRHGHPAGDRVLRTVSSLAGHCVRKCDSVARYGGEEFAVILPETDNAGAVQVGERIRRCVEKMRLGIEDATLHVTVSLGVATHRPENGLNSKSEMILAADRALYEAKRSGRNRLHSA